MKRSIKDVMGHLFKLVSESANQDLSILSECAGILERFAHVPELGKNARLLRDFSDSLRSKQFPAAVKALSTAYDAGCSYDCKDCLRCQQIFYMLLYKKYILERDPDGKLIPPEWYKYSPADFKTMELQPLREELGELFRRQSQPRDYYKLLPKRLPGSSRPDNFFINLKGMSSSSPFMYNSALHTNYVGGGFYVRWEGVGIAVDPGYNFLKNLRDHSLTVYDIDIVIITHDHIDHNHDVRLLTDMAYHLEKTNSIHWYTDTETAQQLKRYLGDAYQETVHLVSGSYPTLIGLNRLALNDRIVLHPFRTNHILSDTARDAGEGLKYNDSSFGFVLELTDKSSGKYQIGYTSDTSFFPELPVNLNGVDLLIANISSVYQEELVEEKQNDLHLGLTGVQKLIQGLAHPPRILALSEFWCGIIDIRYEIAKYIGTYFSAYAVDRDWLILPLELGTSISLPASTVKCSRCGKYAKRVYMLRPNTDFGEILFVCQSCLY